MILLISSKYCIISISPHDIVLEYKNSKIPIKKLSVNKEWDFENPWYYVLDIETYPIENIIVWKALYNIEQYKLSIYDTCTNSNSMIMQFSSFVQPNIESIDIDNNKFNKLFKFRLIANNRIPR